jgi:acyl-CoA dehydrogenase
MLAHDADLELFRDNFRRFMLDHIEPYYATWEKEGIMPREVWNKLGENGYLCVDMPEEYGGYGVPVHYQQPFQCIQKSLRLMFCILVLKNKNNIGFQN